MKIEIGTIAPDFTLPDTEKNKVKLSEQKGSNVVLVFFRWPLQVYVLPNFAV